MSAMKKPVLVEGSEGVPSFEVKSVNKTYQSRDGNQIEALSDVSFKARPREFVTVVGPSGCGKSTLLRILAGINDVTSGDVLIGGRPASGPSTDIGVVFQAPVLLPWRTILENVLVPAEIQGKANVETKNRAHELLELVGLPRCQDSCRLSDFS